MDDTLTFDPQRHVSGWTTRQRRAENATDRIPEHVLGPLIGWALRFVDDFAPDILAAEHAWQDHCARFANGRAGRTDGLRQALRAYLDQHPDIGTPCPATAVGPTSATSPSGSGPTLPA